MSSFNRRDFIKISGVASAGLVLSPQLLSIFQGFFPEESSPLLDNEAIKIPTVCEVCFWNCDKVPH